jgi:hypothetical protein
MKKKKLFYLNKIKEKNKNIYYIRINKTENEIYYLKSYKNKIIQKIKVNENKILIVDKSFQNFLYFNIFSGSKVISKK